MIVPPESAGTLPRSEKQELLRKILLEKIGRTRTAPTSFAQERLADAPALLELALLRESTGA